MQSILGTAPRIDLSVTESPLRGSIVQLTEFSSTTSAVEPVKLWKRKCSVVYLRLIKRNYLKKELLE